MAFHGRRFPIAPHIRRFSVYGVAPAEEVTLDKWAACPPQPIPVTSGLTGCAATVAPDPSALSESLLNQWSPTYPAWLSRHVVTTSRIPTLFQSPLQTTVDVTVEMWLPTYPSRLDVRVPITARAPSTVQPPLADVSSDFLDKWLGSHPDIVRGHAPRPRGGQSAPEPIRPDPILGLWEFKPPDFARGREPNPIEGGMFSGRPVSPNILPTTLDMWHGSQPDFCRDALTRYQIGESLLTPVSPDPNNSQLQWRSVYPNRIWARRPLLNMGGEFFSFYTGMDYLHGTCHSTLLLSGCVTAEPVIGGTVYATPNLDGKHRSNP